jgi:uncharacterized protein YbjT (DUF2867 family)
LILVTGATGNVGAELVSQLVSCGTPLRVLTRNHTGPTLPTTVESFQGDLDQPETLRNALNSVRSVFLLGTSRDMPGVISELRRARVEHVTLLSSRSVIGGHESNTIVRMWMLSEATVRSSGLSWTILQPSSFMSNTLRWSPQLRTGDTIRVPFSRVPIALIDPLDIAAVAAVSLKTESLAGKSYVLSGPEALLPEEQVQILARITGRPLVFQEQSDPEARAELRNLFPEDFVEAMFRFYVEGEFDDSDVVQTVPQITGRPARRFEDWARSHSDLFQHTRAPKKD